MNPKSRLFRSDHSFFEKLRPIPKAIGVEQATDGTDGTVKAAVSLGKCSLKKLFCICILLCFEECFVENGILHSAIISSVTSFSATSFKSVNPTVTNTVRKLFFCLQAIDSGNKSSKAFSQ